MHVFYVLGGGWGHLRRVQRFIEQERLAPIRVLTANLAARRLFPPDTIAWLAADRHTQAPELALMILQKVEEWAPTHWYVDTFPSGILGELPQVTLPQGCKTHWLARRMIWEAYAPHLSPNTQFDHGYAFEPLHPAQLTWLSHHCEIHQGYLLSPPKANPERVAPLIADLPRPHWLIVHSQPASEVQALFDFAQSQARRERVTPSFILLSEHSLDSTEIAYQETDLNPLDWYPLVDRIYCGGGFNTLHEVQPYAAKVLALPFPRRFDDQRERIGRALGK